VASGPSYPRPKRVFDAVVASLLGVLLFPVAGIAMGAMLIGSVARPQDRGPFLYREQRISRGRTFELLKFRALRRDALAAMQGEPHARILEAEQSNLTWAGRRVLKPWYLDELPQLWNVLRGDISLVGPRPWPPSMVDRQVAEGITYRNDFVAGWTGPAQVHKGVTESAGYAELDTAYVQACREAGGRELVRHDVALLVRTVKVIARGEGLRF
jgi:lipopolysaccharide/colanic/teichoic acid biosynthesis glycosyltransferase